MSISRRTALATGATAVVTDAATAPLATKAALAGVPGTAQGEDAELIALGRQWRESYGKWMRCRCEEENTVLLRRVCSIEDRMAEIPARSRNGALVKLRAAAENYRLMGEIDHDPYARLTYQAWQSLETEGVAADFERLAGEARS